MTYIIKQKIRGRIYAYEVQAYWDPVKKQARQKRRYLGVWDEATGTILKKEIQKDVRCTKEFGSAYLLKAISEEKGLLTKLNTAFGKDGNAILALAFAKIIRPTALRNVEHVMEDTQISEMCGADVSFSSQWISDFLVRLGNNERGVKEFCSILIKRKDDALVYDITSLSSYSKNINWLEYGDEYRKLGMPQVNLALVFSVEQKLPIYYKIFPGSVNDVSTLKNLLQEVKCLGIKNGLFVLDRGFYSESNIAEMIQEGIDFIIPLPFSTELAKRMISETKEVIESPDYARTYEGKLYYVIERKVEVGAHSVYAYFLFNETRKADEVETFYNRLIDVEKALDGHRVYANPWKHIEQIAGDFKNYFSYEIKGQMIHLKRDAKAIGEAVNRMGKMVLISSQKLEWKEALSLYRERDAIEKLYDEMKNDMELQPLRVRKNETLKGLVFLYFIAAIVRSLLRQRMIKAKLVEKYSIDEILAEMGKLRAVQIGNIWKLTEITKKQREILKKMNIPVPISVEHSY
ncbi:MAG: IS1634 family transposase [Thermoplasmata archaeon]